MIKDLCSRIGFCASFSLLLASTLTEDAIFRTHSAPVSRWGVGTAATLLQSQRFIQGVAALAMLGMLFDFLRGPLFDILSMVVSFYIGYLKLGPNGIGFMTILFLLLAALGAVIQVFRMTLGMRCAVGLMIFVILASSVSPSG